LSWRKNPETSFSHWTLEIVHTSSASGSSSIVVDVYHVHKCILAFGPRRSDYFAALFQQQMKENQTNISRIELEEESQAKLVPFFYLLDSIYPDEDGQEHSESQAPQQGQQLTLHESFQLLIGSCNTTTTTTQGNFDY
jgi:hypothetical protein